MSSANRRNGWKVPLSGADKGGPETRLALAALNSVGICEGSLLDFQQVDRARLQHGERGFVPSTAWIIHLQASFKPASEHKTDVEII